MKDFTAAVLLLVGAAAWAQSLPAASEPPSVSARSNILLDYQSGKVLAAKASDARIEPASLTKLMTAYVVFDALRQKRLILSQTFTVSERAWRAPGSRMFLEVGSQPMVEMLLHGMIVQSGNDASIALAEAVAGASQRLHDRAEHGCLQRASRGEREPRRPVAEVLDWWRRGDSSPAAFAAAWTMPSSGCPDAERLSVAGS